MEEKRYNGLYQATVSKSHLRELKRVIPPLSSEDEEVPQACSLQTCFVQHLFTPLLPLIGREQEIEAICALLQQTEVRLLTITGPGGVGKTRLALQIPAEVSFLFADGICFVSLVPVRDVDLVLPTIIQALGLTERPNYSPFALMRAGMRDNHFLLILDTFEQVAAAAPQLKG